MQRGAGGTPGGLVEFLIGAVMILIGGYLFFRRLLVMSNMSVLWGTGGSGLALLIMAAGIAVVFFSGRSIIGWLLIIVGLAVIFINVISNLTVYFMPTSLFETILMFVFLFGGLGLLARALRPH